ncbi:MAG: glutamate--tRNA ligase [Chloroflexi bacterium]|nr:glutamate--tRNA ligase [Chloroflexota bacterium]|tara:strand:+ start:20775 stop:22262 length:1488 start_codon:yes stop_codon:yes gene_type:complete
MTKSQENIRVRFAPSPTGEPHLGAMRTALFNWLFAKHHNGKFILRIEDTDQTRKQEGSLENIIKGLEWMGLDWDEGPKKGGEYGPYTQSERKHLYSNAAKTLLDNGHAYLCDRTPEELKLMRETQKREGKPPGYDGFSRNRKLEELEKSRKEGRPIVTRLKVPKNGNRKFTDSIRGEINFDLSTIDDFVILKADGMPTYHLANVVDDHLMQISHVLRGEEWISSTPKHILLYEFLGFTPPNYVHLSLLLGKDKTKLSKRHGATSILEYKNSGFLPEALNNYLTLLGWYPGENQEILSKNEIIKKFNLKGLNDSPAIFDQEKLTWMNGVYIRQSSTEFLTKIFHEELEKKLPNTVKRPVNKGILKKIVPLVKDRLKTTNDLIEYVDFFFLPPTQTDHTIIQKGVSKEETIKILEKTILMFNKQEIHQNFVTENIEKYLRNLIGTFELKTRQSLGTIRSAVTGKDVAPPLFDTLSILGLEECRKRIKNSLEVLNKQN